MRPVLVMRNGGSGGGGSDPYFGSVSALLHFDGADASTSFPDVTGRTWTRAVAEVDTAQSKFGGASGLFNGSASLAAASSADFAYGTSDFTWELFIRASALGANPYILDHGSNGGALLIESGTLKYYNPTTGAGSALYATGAGAISTGVWYHIAVARESGTTRIFVDGVLKISGADANNYGALQVVVGNYGGTGFGFNGHIDELRITKGVARYTAGFTPPVAPFPNS